MEGHEYGSIATRMYIEIEALFRTKFPQAAGAHLAAIRCYGAAMYAYGAHHFPPDPLAVERQFHRALEAMEREAAGILSFKNA